MYVLGYINSMFLVPIMLCVLFGSGFYYMFKLRGAKVLSPVEVTKAVFAKNTSSGVSPFKAVTVALAGTLGVGNIVGVATAIAMGGAGAVFWMLLSSFVAMVLKYAEINLAIQFRRREKDGWHGGASYYIRDGLGKKGLSIFFALLCILASFTMGNIVQINALSQALSSEFNLPPVGVGIFFAILTFIVVYKGFSSISNLTVKLIPALSGLYVLFSLIIIFANITQIPRVIGEIFREAFSPNAAFSGFLGFLFMKGLRYGITRGIGSNEAGCGTAPTAHAAADAKSPHTQGLWGVFEVFVDTVLLCTLTAFVILIYRKELVGLTGIDIAIGAYEQFFGSWAGYIMSGAMVCFAFSTIVCWSYYARESIRFIGGKELAQKLYIYIYCALVVVGAVLGVEFVWELSDLCVSLMAIINCLCIVKLSCFFEKKQDKKL